MVPLDLDLLIVDDEEDFRLALVELFRDAGCRVVAVGTGEDAIAVLEKQPFHAAFVDLCLPQMLGIELITRLRMSWPETEIVVVSGSAWLESAIEAIRHSAVDVLLKPVDDIDSLLGILERVKSKMLAEEHRRHVLEELKRRNAEIELASEWSYRIADSLSLEDVGRSAVAGLSRLSGGRSAVLWVTNAGGELCCTAVCPEHLALDTSNAIDVLADPDGSDGLMSHPEVHKLLGEAFGLPPASIMPLSLGGDLRALYALSEASEVAAPVSAEVLTQYVTRVETGLTRAIQYKRMSESTYRDGLTGLYNRQYLEERLVDEVARSTRYDRPLSVLFMDIDEFKTINDSFGHRAGDQVLLALSSLLTAASGSAVAGRNRASDIPARYGGDEFVLVLPETDAEGAIIKAERVRCALEALPPPKGTNDFYASITVSIGVASFPADAKDSDGLIDAADQALYFAKKNGRNRVATSGDAL
ncbi:MAG: diguanylate cyclase [Myxococcota bacterium]